MHEHISVVRIEGRKYFTRYNVISFHSESELDWMFEVVKTGERMDGFDWTDTPNAKPKYLCFPKKRKINERWVDDEQGKRKVPVYEINQPPPFYNELRDIAIDEGKWRLPGDDAPVQNDSELF